MERAGIGALVASAPFSLALCLRFTFRALEGHFVDTVVVNATNEGQSIGVRKAAPRSPRGE